MLAIPKKLQRTLLLALALLASGCLKKSSPAQALALPGSLNISGTVLNAGGAPVANAPVYIGDDATADATTASDGTFSLSMPSGQLVQLAGSAPAGVNSFYIYAADPSDNTQQAMSSPIDLTLRGSKNLGNLALAQVGSIQGTLLQITAGKQPFPAVSTNVYAGRVSATTDTNGNFSIKGVPIGTLLLTASAPLSAPAQKTAKLVAGQNLVLNSPLVLFPETGVYGYIQIDNTVQISSFVAKGQPFMRTFDVIGNTSAANIRYSEDPSQFGTTGGAKWAALTTSFDHEFAHDGGNTLYYQFGDAGLANFSPVQSMAVVLDQFANTTGFTIADGSGVITTRDAILNIDVPPAAYRMRLAQSTTALSSAPWLAPQATYDWTFTLLLDVTNYNTPQASANYTVYLQFEDASGLLSPAYQASVLMQLFPAVSSSAAVVNINGGAATTTTTLAQLGIQVPPNAAEMLIYEATTTSNLNLLFPAATDLTTPNTTLLWLAASPTAFYNFASIGQKTLFVQFRTVDLAVSPVYQASILVNPFPNGAGGFIINGGAPSTPSPQLTISLNFPPNATGFQIFEASAVAQGYVANQNTNLNGTFSGDVAVNAAWLEPTSTFVYNLTYTGVHTLYVRFEDANSNVSSSYQQTITLATNAIFADPFSINPDASGNSAVVTTASAMVMCVNPPAGYTSDSCVTFYEGVATPSAAGGTCQSLNSALTNTSCISGLAFPYQVNTTGSHTINAIYFSQDNPSIGASNAFSQTIFYQPFPPGAAGLALSPAVTTITSARAAAVNLAINAPPGAISMRLINDNAAGMSTQAYQAYATSVANYALPTTVGVHTVYMQLQDSNGNQSSLYSMQIAVTP